MRNEIELPESEPLRSADMGATERGRVETSRGSKMPDLPRGVNSP